MKQVNKIKPGDIVYLVFDDATCKEVQVQAVAEINSITVGHYLRLSYTNIQLDTNIYDSDALYDYMYDNHNNMWVCTSKECAKEILKDIIHSKIHNLDVEKDTFMADYKASMEMYNSRFDEINNDEIVNM